MPLKDDLKTFKLRLQKLQADIERHIKAPLIRADDDAMSSIANALRGLSDNYIKIEADLDERLKTADSAERDVCKGDIKNLRESIENNKAEFAKFMTLVVRLPAYINQVYAAMSSDEARPALEKIVQNCPELMTYAMRLHERAHARLEQHFQASAAVGAGLFGGNSGDNGNDEANDEQRPDESSHSPAP